MEPSSNHATTPQPSNKLSPGGTLVEPWWNPGGTLVEPWWNPGGTLVEPWWNCRETLPQTTPDHPAALAEPCGTLVMELWWNPGGILSNLTSNHPGPPRSPCRLVEPWWNPGGTLVEPSWNLTSGPPRTSPEPIWAETPKLSAVGEKTTNDLPRTVKERLTNKSTPKGQPEDVFIGRLHTTEVFFAGFLFLAGLRLNLRLRLTPQI